MKHGQFVEITSVDLEILVCVVTDLQTVQTLFYSFAGEQPPPSPVLFSPIHNGPLTRARLQPNYGDTSTFWEAVVVVVKVEEDNFGLRGIVVCGLWHCYSLQVTATI
ncbi:hypothetical protein Hdeb2414_s0024g00649331 [Helianthus debilis subsp. tardiflorus]